jgi:hypothetical protein
VATDGGSGKLIPLQPKPRPISWYYQTKDNIWVPISLLNNFKIDQFRAAAQKDNHKVSQFNIREQIRSATVIEKFFKKVVALDFNKKKLILSGQQSLELRHEKDLDFIKYWKPDMPRTVSHPQDTLGPNDLDYGKVRDVFNLTLPGVPIRSITRYYHVESLEAYQKAGMKINQPAIGLLNEKLLWCWEFTPDIAVKETNTSQFGKGVCLASDAALAASFRSKSEPKRLVLVQVYVGRMFFTENKPKEYEMISDFFNSCVVRVEEGWVYVIPDASRILPLFLIEY